MYSRPPTSAHVTSDGTSACTEGEGRVRAEAAVSGTRGSDAATRCGTNLSIQ
jgi:hypothetical protein